MAVGRKASLRSVTARLLVLGDQRVGKSASIVRYTTGRFIQDYSGSTGDWLYRRPLGYEPKYNVATAVELLEQTDIPFSNTSNIFVNPANCLSNSNCCTSNSLASRVAQDQLIDHELHQRQQLLDKLQWADAYIVIYAINEASTLNKAIKYLNLIDNNINSPQINQKENGSGTSGQKLISRLSPNPVSAGSLSSSGNNISSCIRSSPSYNNNLNSAGRHVKRPILLLGNKRDLESSCRQVSSNDARMLAMRHQTLFAEVSIASSNRAIESVLINLIEQIDPSCLHIDPLSSQQLLAFTDQKTTVTKWPPTLPVVQSAFSVTAPVWASLVRSKPIGATIASASVARLDGQGGRLATPMMSVALGAASKAGKANPKGNGASIARGLDNKSAPEAGKGSSSGHHSSRYESLKSSFKKASMAIVGSRALARGAKASKMPIPSDSKRSSIDEEQTSSGSKNPSASELSLESQSQSHRFRKPLFRYKSRRKTVAFDQLNSNDSRSSRQGSVTDNESLDRFAVASNSDRRPGDGYVPQCPYEAPRCSSARSSSSLSTTDTYYTSPVALSDAERAHSTAGSTSISSSNYSSGYANYQIRVLTRGNSRSTLSRASTSGGSYEESGDETLPRASLTSWSESISPIAPITFVSGLPPQHNRDRKHQIVKSVQNTLINLTKSSNVSAQAAKRSFCNTLLKCANPTLKTETITTNLAKVETIASVPIVGFCK